MAVPQDRTSDGSAVNNLPTARVRYIQSIRPRPSKGGMPEQEFLKIYGRWYFIRREVMEGMERHDQVIHCVKCLREERSGVIHAFRMMVNAEKDLLGNFPSVLKLICMGCGATEMVPSDYDLREIYERPSYDELFKRLEDVRHRDQEMNILKQQAQAMRSMQGFGSLLGQAGAGGNSIQGAASPQMSATEVEIRQREKMLRLSEMYGLGKKVKDWFAP